MPVVAPFLQKTPSSSNPKIHVSHAAISSSYLDPNQPPTKRVPFRQIREVPIVKRLSIALPSHLSTSLRGALTTNPVAQADLTQNASATASNPKINPPIYSKVILSLHVVLCNPTLRTGPYILLSEPSKSSRFIFNNGTLALILDHKTYHSSALAPYPCTAIQSGGRKHEKGSQLYKVVIDLRQPSMVKGKKGFDRLLWTAEACEELSKARNWCVYDLQQDRQMASSNRRRKEENKKRKRGAEIGSDMREVTDDTTVSDVTMADDINNQSVTPISDILSVHHPIHIATKSVSSTFRPVTIPPFVCDPVVLNNVFLAEQLSSQASSAQLKIRPLEEDIHELHEYLSLLFLQSPIVTEDSRNGYDSEEVQSWYRLPLLDSDNTIEPHDQDVAVAKTSSDLEIVTLEGLMSDEYVMQVVVDTIRRSRRSIDNQHGAPDGMWAAIQVQAHQTEPVGQIDGYVILLQGHGQDSEQGTKGDDTHILRDDITKLGGDEEGTTTKVDPGFTQATVFTFVDNVVY